MRVAEDGSLLHLHHPRLLLFFHCHRRTAVVDTDAVFVVAVAVDGVAAAAAGLDEAQAMMANPRHLYPFLGHLFCLQHCVTKASVCLKGSSVGLWMMMTRRKKRRRARMISWRRCLGTRYGMGNDGNLSFVEPPWRPGRGVRLAGRGGVA